MTARAVKQDNSVDSYLASLQDEHTANDARILIAMMRTISGHEPRLWNVGTIGFDSYHYRYDSGREGDAQAIGFYPRKGKITIYLMDGTSRHTELLARLGRHATSRVCISVQRLADLNLPILEMIVKHSYAYIKRQDGQMHRVV